MSTTLFYFHKIQKQITIDHCLALSITFITFFVFSPAINYDFVWDDASYLLNDAAHLSPDFISNALTQPFLSSYYRPIPTLWIYAEAHYTSASTVWMHTTSIMFHAFNTFLICIISINIVKRYSLNKTSKSILILVAGLFFGLHPATIESAAWISGRFDLLLTSFLLLALYADTTIIKASTKALTVGFCFFMAALCKEMALGFALMLPFWHLLTLNRKLKLNISTSRSFLSSPELKTYCSIFLFGLLYLVIRYKTTGFNFSNVAASISLFDHSMLVLKAIGIYFRAILLPFINLSPTHHQDFPIPVTDITSWSVVLLLSIIIILHFSLKTHKLTYFILAIAASLLPVVHIIPLTIAGNIVHDRFLLFPIVVFTLLSLTLVAQNYQHISTRSRIMGTLLAAILLTVNTINTNITLPLWKSDLALWSWATKVDPKSGIAKLNYVISLCNAGMPDEALPLINEHIDSFSESEKSANIILTKAICLEKSENFKIAEDTFMLALEYKIMNKEEYARILRGIARTQLKRNKLDDIEHLLDKSQSLAPYTHATYYNYYLYYVATNEKQLAIEKINIAITLATTKAQQDYYREVKQDFIDTPSMNSPSK